MPMPRGAQNSQPQSGGGPAPSNGTQDPSDELSAALQADADALTGAAGGRVPSTEPPDPFEPEPGEVEDDGIEAAEPTEFSEEDLDGLYFPAGGPRYVLEDGSPCDQEGNPIPATRAEAETGTPPEPAPQDRRQQQSQQRQPFESPFAGGLMTEAERAAAEEVLDGNALGLVETIAARVVDRILAARDQSREASRAMGIPDELAAAASQMEMHIPPAMRGTDEGALTAAALALVQEAKKTGNLQAAMEKYAGAAKRAAGRVPPPPAKPQVVPASGRTFTPRPTPDAPRVVARRRGSSDATNQLFHDDGLEGDVVRMIRRERGKL